MFHKARILVIIAAPLFAGCVSFVDVPASKKGSVENPVLADMPQGQRRYLNRLRGKDGRKVQYKYLDAVLGPKGRILDRFKVTNPAFDAPPRTPLDVVLDMFRAEPKVAPAYRVYMDMYHKGKLDNQTVPGFKLKKLGEKPPKKKKSPAKKTPAKKKTPATTPVKK